MIKTGIDFFSFIMGMDIEGSALSLLLYSGNVRYVILYYGTGRGVERHTI